jgi:pimeloyl-ACP methyl ester carboxylesterase
MPMASVSGADLEVQRLGTGPAVVFVHGSVAPAAVTWRHQRPLAHRWTLILPNRPGFAGSPALEQGDFEAEAPLFAELLGDGAHLVGHSYGAVIALFAAALRPEAVRSLTVSEPGAIRLAAGHPEADAMISNGERLYREADSIPDEVFLRLFREGTGSSRETPQELPQWMRRGVELLRTERPPWEADVPVEALAAAGFPKLVVSGGHSAVFEAVCDALATDIGADRAIVTGRSHSIPAAGEAYNERLEKFISAAERP